MSRLFPSLAAALALGLAAPVARCGVLHVLAGAPAGGDGASWATAFADLRDALAVAGAGDSVWIAEGTYKPDMGTGDRALSFDVAAGVAIHGGFAGFETSLEQSDPQTHVVILSGDLLGDDLPGQPKWKDNSYHVVRTGGGAAPTLLHGLTITGGNSAGTECCGGGVQATAADLTLDGCTIAVNKAMHGAGIFASGGTLHITRSTISGNLAIQQVGGGLFVESSLPTLIEDSRFLGNSGPAGAGAYIDGDATVLRTVFLGNQTNSGGGGALGGTGPGTLLIRDCCFAGNSGHGSGGALFFDGVSLQLERSTIAFNMAKGAGSGGGVFLGAGSGPAQAVADSTVFWGNSGGAASSVFDAQVHLLGGATFAATACTINGLPLGFPGAGNDDSDPQFVDPAGPDLVIGTADDDLRLAPGSPCIDAGSPSGPLAALDADGFPRNTDGDLDGSASIDRGAFEYCPGVLSIGATELAAGQATLLSLDGEPGLPGFVLVGLQGPVTAIGHYGALLVALQTPWLLAPWGSVPSSSTLHVPASFPLGLTIVIQGLVAAPSGQAAALSNAVTLHVE